MTRVRGMRYLRDSVLGSRSSTAFELITSSLDTIWPRQAAGTVGSLLQDLQTMPTGYHLAETSTVGSLLQDLQTMPTGHHLAKTGSRYSRQLATRPSDNAHWIPSGRDRYSGQLATTRPSDTGQCPLDTIWPRQVQWAACYNQTFRHWPMPTGHHLAKTGTVGSLLQPDL